MEIIPILSTIILVATIATFVLAIAAYVLYKIRERRARQGGVVRTDVVMGNDAHVLVTPQPALLGQPYAPALMPMQMAPPLALQAPQQQYATMPGMGGMQQMGMPGPVAVDANADGRYDTVYEPRPTYQNPLTGEPVAYQPSPDATAYPNPGPAYANPGMAPRPMAPPVGASQMPGMPGLQGLPGMVAAQPIIPVAPMTPAAAPGSMFYEVTQQGLVPTPGVATAAATDQERVRLGAIQREQDRLQNAEDASKDRLDTLRRQQDSPAWL